MFRGSFDIRTDDKGRIIVPVKFRAKLGEQFIIARSISNCLYAMTEDEWESRYENKFAEKNSLDEESKMLERFLANGLMEASCDPQGRVAINQNLRTYAGIGMQDDVFMIGMSNRIEIWSKERWEALNDSITDATLAACARAVGI